MPFDEFLGPSSETDAPTRILYHQYYIIMFSEQLQGLCLCHILTLGKRSFLDLAGFGISAEHRHSAVGLIK